MFNIVYQQFIAMYDSGCQICCNWSRLELVLMCQHNLKYHAADKHDAHVHPVTLN